MPDLYEMGCSILIAVCDSCYAGWPRRITSVEDGRMSGREGGGTRGEWLDEYATYFVLYLLVMWVVCQAICVKFPSNTISGLPHLSQ